MPTKAYPDRRPGKGPGERGPHVCAGHKWQSWLEPCPKCAVIAQKQEEQRAHNQESHRRSE